MIDRKIDSKIKLRILQRSAWTIHCPLNAILCILIRGKFDYKKEGGMTTEAETGVM